MAKQWGNSQNYWVCRGKGSCGQWNWASHTRCWGCQRFNQVAALPKAPSPPTLGVWMDQAKGKGGSNKKAPQVPQDPLAGLAAALERVKVSIPDHEEVQTILDSSAALIEKEKKRKADKLPDWCRLRDLQSKLAKKQKAEESAKVAAKDFLDKAEAARAESQNQLGRASSLAKEIKALEKEVEALGPLALEGSDQAKEEKSSGPWLPNRLRKVGQQVQPDGPQAELWKAQLEALAKAQKAVEELAEKITTPEPEAGADGQPSGSTQGGQASKSDDAMDTDHERSVLSDQDLEKLVQKVSDSIDSEASDDAKKRIAEAIKTTFQACKKHKSG